MTAPARALPGTDHPFPEPAFDDQGMPARHASLMDNASRIRVRKRTLPVDRILLAAASIMTPLGVVFILLAWYGAAHTPKVYEQMDYLISGGVLGATLTVLGGLLYFGYWLTRQLQESRRESALALQAYRRLEDAMVGLPVGRRVNGNGANGGPRPAGGPVAAGEQPAPADGQARAGRQARAGGQARTGGQVAAGERPAGERPAGERPAGQRPSVGRSAPPIGTAGDPPAPAAGGPEAGNDEPTRETASPLVATPRGNLLHRPDCPIVARRPGTRPVAPGTEGFGYCRMCDAEGVLT